MLGERIMNECEKYLGLPMPSGKSKVRTFEELQEKISKRVLRWKEKFISKTGQEILIKTMAQAIPTYSMSLFKLPRTICDNIIPFWQNIDGVKSMKSGKFIRLIGVNYALKKREEE